VTVDLNRQRYERNLFGSDFPYLRRDLAVNCVRPIRGAQLKIVDAFGVVLKTYYFSASR
jgi:hypothetical protein